jgi:L-iditol 2-dehydrogenase
MPPGDHATMPAAVYHAPRDVTLERLPIPVPEAGEVLIEVSHCGVCGSDLHTIIEGWGRPGTVGGHEYAGTIVAIGPGVEDWTAGRRCAVDPNQPCGTCDKCRSGRSALCRNRDRWGDGPPHQGAFARYTKVRADQLVPVPDGLSLRIAALVEPLAVAMHAVDLSEVLPGARVLVTGGGPIGLLVTAALRVRGAGEIVVSEPASARRRRALEVGATRAVEPPDLPAVPPMPFDVVAEPFAAAFDCSGRAEAMEQALGQLDRAGRLVLVGAGMTPPRFDPNRILMNELVVTGSYCVNQGGLAGAMELLASGQLPVDRLIEPEDVPLDGLLDAAVALHEGRLAAKVMVVPEVTDG